MSRPNCIASGYEHCKHAKRGIGCCFCEEDNGCAGRWTGTRHVGGAKQKKLKRNAPAAPKEHK